MASINLQEIERLTAVKEKEWKEANSMQISALAAALENKESECQEYKDMLIQLKKDFKYNLGVSCAFLPFVVSIPHWHCRDYCHDQ